MCLNNSAESPTSSAAFNDCWISSCFISNCIHLSFFSIAAAFFLDVSLEEASALEEEASALVFESVPCSTGTTGLPGPPGSPEPPDPPEPPDT